MNNSGVSKFDTPQQISMVLKKKNATACRTTLSVFLQCMLQSLLEHCVETIWEVVTAYVIIHNMIVKDECDDSLYDQVWEC